MTNELVDAAISFADPNIISSDMFITLCEVPLKQCYCINLFKTIATVLID